MTRTFCHGIFVTDFCDTVSLSEFSLDVMDNFLFCKVVLSGKSSSQTLMFRHRRCHQGQFLSPRGFVIDTFVIDVSSQAFVLQTNLFVNVASMDAFVPFVADMRSQT